MSKRYHLPFLEDITGFRTFSQPSLLVHADSLLLEEPTVITIPSDSHCDCQHMTNIIGRSPSTPFSLSTQQRLLER